jgi:hypothetical protein
VHLCSAGVFDRQIPSEMQMRIIKMEGVRERHQEQIRPVWVLVRDDIRDEAHMRRGRAMKDHQQAIE